MNIRREIRKERKDVYTIYETKKELDQNDNIVEVDVNIKEAITHDILETEKNGLQAQIDTLQSQIDVIGEMQSMIINFKETE
jgi:hypothetical protein